MASTGSSWIQTIVRKWGIFAEPWLAIINSKSKECLAAPRKEAQRHSPPPEEPFDDDLSPPDEDFPSLLPSDFDSVFGLSASAPFLYESLR